VLHAALAIWLRGLPSTQPGERGIEAVSEIIEFHESLFT
jgi:hypothetical protein